MNDTQALIKNERIYLTIHINMETLLEMTKVMGEKILIG